MLETGVLFRYGSGWNAVVVECVAELTGDPAYDEKAFHARLLEVGPVGLDLLRSELTR